jgi:hypothetical protein
MFLQTKVNLNIDAYSTFNYFNRFDIYIRLFNNNIHRKNPTQFGLAKSSGNAILSKHSQPNREIIESQKKIRPKA